MQICKKITVSGINGVRAGFRDVSKKRLVARIVGIAHSFEVKDTTYGESIKFSGEFRAFNEDGEEFAAPVLYLPAPADGLMSAALTEANGSAVNFGFDIFIQAREKKNPQDLGYEYSISPLMETAPSDPLANLMAGLPALPLSKKPEQLVLPGNGGESAQGTEKPKAKKGA